MGENFGSGACVRAVWVVLVGAADESVQFGAIGFGLVRRCSAAFGVNLDQARTLSRSRAIANTSSQALVPAAASSARRTGSG